MEELQFSSESHTYHLDGTKYRSVTSLIASFFDEFNSSQVIDNMMKRSSWPNSKYYGMTKSEIMELWKNNCEEASKKGTFLHKQIEEFLDNESHVYDDSSEDSSPEYEQFLQWRDEHNHLKPVFQEQKVFDKRYQVAGTVDAVFFNTKTQQIELYDWKRVSKVPTYGVRQGKGPLDNVKDCKYWRYVLQLNMYRYLLKAFKDPKMFIVQFHPDLENYVQTEVPQKDELIQKMLEYSAKDIVRGTHGIIRVGRRIYSRDGKFTDPSYEGFTPLVTVTKCTKYGHISPYVLKWNGIIFENLWQASKVYKEIEATVQRCSRYDDTIIWERGAETHVKKKGKKWVITPAYKKWRKDLMDCDYPVRYPVGYRKRRDAMFSLKGDAENFSTKTLNYIEARKEIYEPLFIECLKETDTFQELKERLEGGENFLIIDVDGPHQESLQHYQIMYDLEDDFIDQDSMIATDANLDIMINDPKHSYGHGFCIARALLAR